MEIPSLYKRMHEIVTELKTKSDITDILEVGCGRGDFVDYLRKGGFSSFGIDIDGKMLMSELVEQGYLFHLDSHAIREIFWDRQFDLVMTNRVLSLEAAGNLLLERYGGGRIMPNREEVKEFAQVNAVSILEAALFQLKHGGYFSSVIDDFDRSSVTADMAEKFGYKIIKYELQEFVLQKP